MLASVTVQEDHKAKNIQVVHLHGLADEQELPQSGVLISWGFKVMILNQVISARPDLITEKACAEQIDGEEGASQK